jgi:hypothetical protein
MTILPTLSTYIKSLAILPVLTMLSACASTSDSDNENKNNGGYLSSIFTSGSKIVSDVLLGEGDVSTRTKEAVYSETNDKVSEAISDNINDDDLRSLSAVVLVVPEDTISIRERRTYRGATIFTASTKDGRHFSCVFDARNHEIEGAKLVKCSN